MHVHSISFPILNYVMILLFSECSLDKPQQKFEMRSYDEELVISQVKYQMKEDIHLLICYKNKVVKLTKELEVLKRVF